MGVSLTSALSTCFDDVDAWNRYGSIDAQIVVIAATNEPWAIDDGFLRSGRLGKQLFVGTLDLVGRTELISDWYFNQKRKSFDYIAKYIDDGKDSLERQSSSLQSSTVSTVHVHVSSEEIDWIAEIACHCEGFTAADVQLLINKVCLQAYMDNVLLPTKESFQSILEAMQPSVSRKELKEYDDWKLSRS